MDTEAQPTPTNENGTKIEESSSDPPGENGNVKEDLPKIVRITRQTRSRSRTPQKQKPKDKTNEENKSKREVAKVLSLSPKNGNESTNGDTEKISEKSKIKEDKKVEEKPKSQEKLKTSKNSETENGNKEETPKKPKDAVNNEVSNKETVESEENHTEKSPKKLSKKASKSEGEAVEMDPLILATDEPDPELQFDENSDLESGKGSPVQLRCKTRRSHTRYIPTPKTPKSTDSDSEKNSSVAPTPTPENLNDTNDSMNIGDISTKAEVGSDATRLDYMAHNSTIISEDNSYLNYSRDRSLGETLRTLSPRKTFRPINDAYRQRAFKNNQNKSDLNLPYFEHDSINRITGIKRKRSSTPEERKKFKGDSTGFVSYLVSPLTNLKNRFMTDVSSSTPKLTGYKDSKKDIHEDISYTEIVSETPEKKNWCAIM